MAKATKPVTVSGIEFDALISSEYSLEATVPEYSTEDGFTVSDSVILKPETLSLVLYVTNTPVTWRKQHYLGRTLDRVEYICDELEDLYYRAKPIKIVTSDRTYTNMVIESITISKSLEDGYAREIPISFRKIRKTSARTAGIPGSYGKAGTSNQSAGTADTSIGYADDFPTESYDQGSTTDTSSYTTSSNGGSNNGNKGSILYNIGNNLGIIK